jgi:hypothetical protein
MNQLTCQARRRYELLVHHQGRWLKSVNLTPFDAAP